VMSNHLGPRPQEVLGVGLGDGRLVAIGRYAWLANKEEMNMTGQHDLLVTSTSS
jgi:hypothetical protein